MNLGSTTHKISGPPGTGKTTYLLNVVDDLLKKGADPKKIGFVTFTKAGANEAAERARTKFGLDESSFPWFRTLHSMCLRAIGSECRVVGNKHLCEVAKALGLMFTLNRKVQDGQFMNSTRGDHILSVYNLSILKRTNLADEVKNYDGCHLSRSEVQQFADYYHNYKQHNKLIDFSDMLWKFVQGNRGVNIDYLIVDEAQDLCRLQWMVVQKLAKGVKQVWVAGDDDQAIFAWAGASPEILIELKGQHEVLSQSYRIPSSVHTLAEGITAKLQNRLEKKYGPRDAPGRINRINNLDQVEIRPASSWLFLGRNLQYLESYSSFLFSRGVPFESPFDDDSFRRARQAVCAWRKVSGGELISGREVKNLYQYLPVREAVTYGFKKKLVQLDDKDDVDLDLLKKEYGLCRTGEWKSVFRMKPETMSYIEKAEQTGMLDQGEKIEINTIHGSKGREADNVVIDLNMTNRTYQGYLSQPDNEHRVFYVGVTRARENLYILSPNGGRHYDL